MNDNKTGGKSGTYGWMNVHKKSSLDIFTCKSSKMYFIKSIYYVSFLVNAHIYIVQEQTEKEKKTYTTELG